MWPVRALVIVFLMHNKLPSVVSRLTVLPGFLLVHYIFDPILRRQLILCGLLFSKIAVFQIVPAGAIK